MLFVHLFHNNLVLYHYVKLYYEYFLNSIKNGESTPGTYNSDVRTINTNNSSNTNANFSELKAEEILKQLSINNTDM